MLRSRVMEEEKATAQRVFTISEVNALIPALSTLVGDQLREQSEIEQGLAELMRLTGSPPRSLEPHRSDTGEVHRLKDNLRERISRYETGWQRVQKWGGVIKDPQTGLVDFYGRVDGRLVWLCWRWGAIPTPSRSCGAPQGASSKPTRTSCSAATTST
jgi:hypothetical protein